MILEPLPIVPGLSLSRFQGVRCCGQGSRFRTRASFACGRGQGEPGQAADHWEEREADSAGHTHLPTHVGFNGGGIEGVELSLLLGQPARLLGFVDWELTYLSAPCSLPSVQVKGAESDFEAGEVLCHGLTSSGGRSCLAFN